MNQRMPTITCYLQRNLTGGIGHNLPQEAPGAFAAAVIDVDAF